MTEVKGKVVIVTGANAGMGKAICLELAQKGYEVIMACRNQSRGQEALNEIKDAVIDAKVHLYICDLSSLVSIKMFAQQVLKDFSHIDILINNAGVILLKRALTEDGFEMQYGVNHLGHFYLTKLLLKRLIESGHSRIVNVSSGAHQGGKIHFRDLQLKKTPKLLYAFSAYSQSKLANVLFTYELSRHLEKTNVTVNCCHPGAVGTSMGVNRETGFGRGLLKFLGHFFLTPLEGAQTTLYLATSSEVEGITGQYFYKKRIARSSKISHDRQIARKLWKISERQITKALTGH